MDADLRRKQRARASTPTDVCRLKGHEVLLWVREGQPPAYLCDRCKVDLTDVVKRENEERRQWVTAWREERERRIVEYLLNPPKGG